LFVLTGLYLGLQLPLGIVIGDFYAAGR
jgi:hypothetical protein